MESKTIKNIYKKENKKYDIYKIIKYKFFSNYIKS